MDSSIPQVESTEQAQEFKLTPYDLDEVNVAKRLEAYFTTNIGTRLFLTKRSMFC